MSILTVGSGMQYSAIGAAVDAAQIGDVINVQAGVYVNDFVTIRKSLTLNAVDGVVTMAATANSPDGKAIMTEGAPGLTVNINGFAFTGAKVNDENGAGIRYEGGTLNISNSHFYNNQNGILAGSDPNGVVSISNSEFDHNGFGDGRTHNIYIGDIKSFTLTGSYSHDANVGHEVKSRAEINTITDNRILDIDSNSSYEIDLPNGGDAVISGNTIQQSSNSLNVNIIAYGEEGMLRASNSLQIVGNTIVNDRATGVALWNASSVNATFANNLVYSADSTTLVTGPAMQSGTVVLSSRPTLDTSPIMPLPTSSPVPTSTPTPIPIPVPDPTPVPTPDPVPPPTPTPATLGLVVNVNEDAYLGDAEFTISVDGEQVSSIYVATALRGDGETQAINVGTLNAGSHVVGITFLNDAYDGTADTDRNLFVASATYDGVPIPNSMATLYSTGAVAFSVSVASPITSTAVINVSEDAYMGHAQFTLAVDGKPFGGVYTATAPYEGGKSEAITITGIPQSFTPHDIAVTFLNDAYGGSPNLDRNLYVKSIQFDDQTIVGSAVAMFSSGTEHFITAAPSGFTG